MRHHRFAAHLTSLALALGAVTVAASPAEAAGCVTRSEYSKVGKGTTLARVHRVFGTKGRLLFQNPGNPTNGAREYSMCGAWAAATGDTRVQIQYNNYASGGGAFRVVYKQHY